MQEQAKTLIKSGFLPDKFRKVEQVIAIGLKSQELGIGMMEGLANLYIVNGKVEVNGQLMLSLAYRSGKLKEGGLIIEETPTSCTVTGTRINGVTFSSTWDFERARTAGLTDTMTYRKYLSVMLRWRAISEVLRVLVPDVISGLYTPDEIGENFVVEQGEVRIADEPKDIVVEEKLIVPEMKKAYVEEPVPSYSSDEIAHSITDLLDAEIDKIERKLLDMGYDEWTEAPRSLIDQLIKRAKKGTL